MQKALRNALTAKFEEFGPEVLSVTLECFKEPRLVPTVMHALKLGVIYGTEDQARKLYQHAKDVGPEDYLIQLKMAIWRAAQTETRVAKTDAAVDRLRKKLSGEIPRTSPKKSAPIAADLDACVEELDKLSEEPEPAPEPIRPAVPEPVAVKTPVVEPVHAKASRAEPQQPVPAKVPPPQPVRPPEPVAVTQTAPVEPTPAPETAPESRPFIEVSGYMGPDRRVGAPDRRAPRDRRSTLEAVSKNRRYGGDRRKSEGRRDQDP